MHRRRFLGLAAATGAAALAGADNAPAFRPPALPQPLGLYHPAEAKARKLIIPTDVPDRFKVKVMEFNPVPAPDPATWQLEVTGLVDRPIKLRVADLKHFAMVNQASRLKCVQCWSAKIQWEGFRAGELLKLVRPKKSATHVRFDCADMYYDYVSLDELLHPRTLFALKMNGEPLTPEHGAPLRVVIPFKYGYKSSKLICKITLLDHGGQGVVADTWPYYSQSGNIEPGYDHPYDYPGQTRKIKGGEITEY